MPSPRRRALPTGFATIRDIITFGLGTVIVCNEVFVSRQVEMTAIALGAAMMGLPLVFNADERRKSGDSNDPPSEGKP